MPGPEGGSLDNTDEVQGPSLAQGRLWACTGAIAAAFQDTLERERLGNNVPNKDRLEKWPFVQR